MAPSRRKAKIGIVLIFLCGVMIGLSTALAVSRRTLVALAERSALPQRDWLVRTLAEKLELSAEQISSVREFYDETEIDRQIARIRARPTTNEPAYRLLDLIGDILSDEQRVKLDSVIADTVTANRPPCLGTLVLALKLTLVERQSFDLVLARFAEDERLRASPTVERACIDLLESSRAELAPVIGDARSGRPAGTRFPGR